MKMNAYAKINISLDVVRKRPDNYHDLKMIMQTISLHDVITVEKHDECIITSDNLSVPCSKSNIAYICAKKLLDIKGINKGFKIHIEKNIPIAAGLAGGSSDGAVAMKAINQLYKLGFSDDELKEISSSIGADIPYCIEGGTCLAEGIGDILTPLSPFECENILLVKPPINVSTPWVYKNLKLDDNIIHPDTDKVIECMKSNNLKDLGKYSGNLLQNVTEEEFPVISEIKNQMINYGAVFSLMSGSGPSVFGIFSNKANLDDAYSHFKKFYKETFRVKTVNQV